VKPVLAFLSFFSVEDFNLFFQPVQQTQLYFCAFRNAVFIYREDKNSELNGNKVSYLKDIHI
jgi:hypothetical protein